MNWVNQFAVAKPLGFTYFNTYVNPANGLVLGWVTRRATGPYTIYYFAGQTGQGLATGTRGTARHAMEAVDGAIKSAGVTIGIYQMDIPKLTIEIVKAGRA